MNKRYFFCFIPGLIVLPFIIGCGHSNPAGPSPTKTASPTVTITCSATYTPTITDTATDSPTGTATYTVTLTSTDTCTFTVTPTATPTATCTSTPYHMALQQGLNAYAGAADNQLDQASPNNNFGASAFGFIRGPAGSVSRLLIKYDLTSVLTAGNTVVQANLIFILNNINGVFDISPYVMDTDWVEGACTGGGCPSYSSWNNYDTGLPWTNAGGDFGAVAGPPSTMDSAVSASVPRTVTIYASVVNSWLLTPANNNGLMIKSNDETGTGFMVPYLKEYNAVPASRPVLDLYYY